jgi:hypothetical protein
MRCTTCSSYHREKHHEPTYHYDFGRFIAEQTEKWAKVIRAAHIKAE